MASNLNLSRFLSSVLAAAREGAYMMWNVCCHATKMWEFTERRHWDWDWKAQKSLYDPWTDEIAHHFLGWKTRIPSTRRTRQMASSSPESLMCGKIKKNISWNFFGFFLNFQLQVRWRTRARSWQAWRRALPTGRELVATKARDGAVQVVLRVRTPSMVYNGHLKFQTSVSLIIPL